MDIIHYVILFFMYACLGWVIESVNEIIRTGKFVNRGFLVGPICPIYGYGGVLITLLLSKYYKDPVVLFIMSMAICSILEYVTSYVMEKIFKARWWDYSNRKFNINGRICLETMIPFGLLGLLSIYIMKPFLLNVMNLVSYQTLKRIAIVLVILMVFDTCISFKVIINFKTTLKKFEKDNTEEITKKVKQILMNRSLLHRRLLEAFPRLNIKWRRKKS